MLPVSCNPKMSTHKNVIHVKFIGCTLNKEGSLACVKAKTKEREEKKVFAMGKTNFVNFKGLN